MYACTYTDIMICQDESYGMPSPEKPKENENEKSEGMEIQTPIRPIFFDPCADNFFMVGKRGSPVGAIDYYTEHDSGFMVATFNSPSVQGRFRTKVSIIEYENQCVAKGEKKPKSKSKGDGGSDDTPKTHKRVGAKSKAMKSQKTSSAKSKAMKSQKTSSAKSSKYKLVYSKVYHQVKTKMLKGKKPTKKLLKLATEKARKAGKNAAADV